MQVHQPDRKHSIGDQALQMLPVVSPSAGGNRIYPSIPSCIRSINAITTTAYIVTSILLIFNRSLHVDVIGNVAFSGMLAPAVVNTVHLFGTWLILGVLIGVSFSYKIYQTLCATFPRHVAWYPLSSLTIACCIVAATHLQLSLRTTLYLREQIGGAGIVEWVPLRLLCVWSVLAVVTNCVLTACQSTSRLHIFIQTCLFLWHILGVITRFAAGSITPVIAAGLRSAIAVLMCTIITCLLIRFRARLLPASQTLPKDSSTSTAASEPGRVTQSAPPDDELQIPAARYMVPMYLVFLCAQMAWEVTRSLHVVPAEVVAAIDVALDVCRVLTLCTLVMFHMRTAVRSLQSTVSDLRSALDIQEMFLGYVCHEVRVPLQGMVLATQEFAEASSWSPAQKSDLDIIMTATDAMSRVLNDCLSLSAMQSGKFTLTPSVFSPRALVDTVLKLFHFKSKQVHVHVELDAPSLISADMGRLCQVLANFTSNAVKFTPDAGTIRFRVLWCADESHAKALVSSGTWNVDPASNPEGKSDQHAIHVLQPPCNADAGYALFVVEDTGAGISEVDQSKLFIPFEHVRAAVTKSTVGTGLGLSIARRIVSLSGGHIGCWSQQGQGSRFWFTVPALSLHTVAADWDRSRSISAVSPTPLLTQSLYSAHSDGGCVNDGLHVLTPLSFNSAGAETYMHDAYNHAVVVDDTESNRLLLARLLSRLHVAAHISMAANGAEALCNEDWLSADIWFIDRNMPVMDGLQLCKALRARGYTGPIVAVTGDSLGKHQQELLDAGASMVLLKPCTKADIMRVASPRSTLTANSWQIPVFSDQ